MSLELQKELDRVSKEEGWAFPKVVKRKRPGKVQILPEEVRELRKLLGGGVEDGRGRLGMTQTAFGKMWGVKYLAVIRWEKGILRPRLHQRKRMLRMLEVARGVMGGQNGNGAAAGRTEP